MTSTPPGVYIQWRISFHRNESGLRKRKRRNIPGNFECPAYAHFSLQRRILLVRKDIKTRVKFPIFTICEDSVPYPLPTLSLQERSELPPYRTREEHTWMI